MAETTASGVRWARDEITGLRQIRELFVSQKESHALAVLDQGSIERFLYPQGKGAALRHVMLVSGNQDWITLAFIYKLDLLINANFNQSPQQTLRLP